MIVYTLVDTELRDDDARALHGGTACTAATCSGSRSRRSRSSPAAAAKMESGRRPPLDSQYFKRMAAIEFAVKYDDGIGAGLGDADIVLVGVSRTSKTPLSMYLGYLGHKVANVPIVRGIDPPKELFEIDRAKIVGLTIDAERLSQIRQVRARLMRLSTALVLRAGRDLRGARAGGRGAPAARLSRRRRLRALDRGDGAARPSARRASQGRERGTDGVKQKEAGSALAVGDVVGVAGARARPVLRALPADLARDPARAAFCAGTVAEDHGGVTTPHLGRSGRMASDFVHDFDDVSTAGNRELLGGKGVGLAEMTQIGVPVPPGFTDHDRRVPRVHRRGEASPGRSRGRDGAARRATRGTERQALRRSEDPLLVSVRSGAAVSMPGMMDTILNLGLSDVSAEGLARTANARSPTTRTGG